MLWESQHVNRIIIFIAIQVSSGRRRPALVISGGGSSGSSSSRRSTNNSSSSSSSSSSSRRRIPPPRHDVLLETNVRTIGWDWGRGGGGGLVPCKQTSIGR